MKSSLTFFVVVLCATLILSGLGHSATIFVTKVMLPTLRSIPKISAWIVTGCHAILYFGVLCLIAFYGVLELLFSTRTETITRRAKTLIRLD